MNTYMHGECVIVKSQLIPKDAKKITAKNGSYKIADSETTGNFHLVEEKQGVDMYEKDGVLYLKNEVPANVFCAHAERHDTITLEPGIWEIEPAKEYDYLSQEVRNVAD